VNPKLEIAWEYRAKPENESDAVRNDWTGDTLKKGKGTV